MFADLDGAPLANAWNVPLAPGWVSRTSAGRYHVFWRVADIATAEFAPLQKEIAARTGGDRAIHDLPRVMRLPGFPHQKGKPYPVEGLPIAGTDRRYALAAHQSEACYVETARPGDRNNTLNKAAFCAGTLIPAGGISASEVEEVLTVAAFRNADGRRPSIHEMELAGNTLR